MFALPDTVTPFGYPMICDFDSSDTPQFPSPGITIAQPAFVDVPVDAGGSVTPRESLRSTLISSRPAPAHEIRFRPPAVEPHSLRTVRRLMLTWMNENDP